MTAAWRSSARRTASPSSCCRPVARWRRPNPGRACPTPAPGSAGNPLAPRPYAAGGAPPSQWPDNRPASGDARDGLQVLLLAGNSGTRRVRSPGAGGRGGRLYRCGARGGERRTRGSRNAGADGRGGHAAHPVCPAVPARWRRDCQPHRGDPAVFGRPDRTCASRRRRSAMDASDPAHDYQHRQGDLRIHTTRSMRISGSTIRRMGPSRVQRFSAGTGCRNSSAGSSGFWRRTWRVWITLLVALPPMPICPCSSCFLDSVTRFPSQSERELAKLPRVTALHKAVAERPRLKAYLASERRVWFNETGIFRRYPELDG